MTIAAKKKERVDLEKVAAQLASVKILPVAEEGNIALRVTAKFTTRTFVAGRYNVAVGISHALLHLDHPSFEAANAYQATLPTEVWSESSKHAKATHLGGEAKVKVGAKLFGWLSGTAEAQAGKNSQRSAEQKTNAAYRIVTAIPSGWQIGTELGDPRTPEGSLPAGLEWCLNGEYLTGRNGEEGDGYKDKYGVFALCTLSQKVGGNDLRIAAMLLGVNGSLKVAITPASPVDSSSSALQSQNHAKEHEEALRRAFVEICLQRAEAAHADGAKTDAMLTGELYLNYHEIHAPELGKSAPSEAHMKPRIDSNEKAILTEQKK